MCYESCTKKYCLNINKNDKVMSNDLKIIVAVIKCVKKFLNKIQEKRT